MAALHNYPVSIEMVVILIMRGGGASEDVEVVGDNSDDDLDDLGDIYCHVHYVGVRGNVTRVLLWRGWKNTKH